MKLKTKLARTAIKRPIKDQRSIFLAVSAFVSSPPEDIYVKPEYRIPINAAIETISSSTPKILVAIPRIHPISQEVLAPSHASPDPLGISPPRLISFRLRAAKVFWINCIGL